MSYSTIFTNRKIYASNILVTFVNPPPRIGLITADGALSLNMDTLIASDQIWVTPISKVSGVQSINTNTLIGSTVIPNVFTAALR